MKQKLDNLMKNTFTPNTKRYIKYLKANNIYNNNLDKTFFNLNLWIMISGGKGRKRYITPSMSIETDAPIAPIPLVKAYKKMQMPMASTKIPLMTEKGF